MNPRFRRLTMDLKQIRDQLTGHRHVTVVPVGAEPPETYLVTYEVRGVALDGTGAQPVFVEHHVVRIELGAGYPREKPRFLMQTPIFHPNFDSQVGQPVCIGDYWTPAQPLVDLILKVGDMIQYREYNVAAPLNGDAARWVRHSESQGIFPVGDVALWEPEVELALTATSSGPTPTPFSLAPPPPAPWPPPVPHEAS